MNTTNKLFLYSFAFSLSTQQSNELAKLVQKKPQNITIAVIDNAADIIPDSKHWVKQARETLLNYGFKIDVVDLNSFKKNVNDKELRKALSADIIWLGGGNTFYLRWILRESGADEIIIDLINNGAVYAGWSAGAIIAGPTLEGVENMEETSNLPEMITTGLNLTSTIVIPHIDNPDFFEAAKKTVDVIQKAGFHVQPLTDSQALVIDGGQERVI